jgi:hypothetical protein
MFNSAALYNHSSRNATARQLNISSSSSGRTSYSYTSSQLPLVLPEPEPEPEPHPDGEYYGAPMDMDVDDDPTPGIDNIEEEENIEVVPGVHVHIVPKATAKRYENSVGILSHNLRMSLFCSYRMSR